MSRELKVGDFAPDFILKDQHGEVCRLSAFKGKSNVVLYFYPKDDTPGCTVEACGFRDHYYEFQNAGTEILGISSDNNTSHLKFASKHKLPFILLSDMGSKVRKLYNIPNSFLFIPGRVTFVIDKLGIIRYIFNSQLQADKHVQEAIKMLDQL